MNPVSIEKRFEIEAFIYRAARLTDESNYDEWETLLANGMQYWVPQDPADYEPGTRLSFINDNRARLATRLHQLRTRLRHAQTPPSPMRRILSNIKIKHAEDGYHAAGNFALHEHAVQATNTLRVWVGRVTYELHRGLRMHRKVVELVNSSGALPSLDFLI